MNPPQSPTVTNIRASFGIAKRCDAARQHAEKADDEGAEHVDQQRAPGKFGANGHGHRHCASQNRATLPKAPPMATHK